MSAVDPDLSPPTAAIKFLLQFMPLPTLRLEAGDFFAFLQTVFLSKIHDNILVAQTALGPISLVIIPAFVL